MPPGPLLGQKGAAYADVASANSTLNTLIPGRQKSWMTNTPFQPSPRRARPQDSGPPPSRQPTVDAHQQSNQQTHSWPQAERESQARSTRHQPQQAPSTTPANVLPSPAPSDEPSPAALSNYKDSPNLPTVSLAPVSRCLLNTATTSASESCYTGSSALQNPDTEVLPSKADSEAVGAVATPSENAVHGALAQASRSLVAMLPPGLPHGRQNETSQGGAIALGPGTNFLDWNSRSDSTGAQEHPNKRRRVDTNSTFAVLVALIDKRIAQLGGLDKLSSDVEGPRFALLKDACAKGDIFYLRLHSLYCLWSCNPQSLPPLLTQDLDGTHKGFSIIESVLKSNSGFRHDNLLWCATFPRKTFNEDDPVGVKKVANFLSALFQFWPSLSTACSNRHYPYLVDELLGKFQCYSVCMQNILFTASRRRLGFTDGCMGDEVQRLFRLDQEQHMDEQGSFRQVILSKDPDDIERHNLILIRAYREILSKVEAAQRERMKHQGEQLFQEQRHQLQDLQEQHRQQEDQRQAAVQQVTQQYRQREQLQQVHTLVQQQHMRNSQAMFIAQQQQPQMANKVVLEQLQAQTRRLHPGQRQQMHSQWAQVQMQGGAMGSHARRTSLNTHRQIVQPAGQFGRRPQSSGPMSRGPCSSFPHNSFLPQNVGHHLNQVSSSFILPSNSPTSPGMPGAGAAQLQYQHNMPQPQQNTQGQTQMRHGPWPASAPSPTIAQSPQMSTARMAIPAVSPVVGRQQTWSRPQSRAATQLQMPQPRMSQLHVGQAQVLQQQMGQQQIIQHQMRQQLLHPTMQHKSRLVPARGQVIDRSEHPHSHQEKKSLLMSLHQAHARSPDRTRCNGDVEERYYQSVQSLAVPPLRLVFYHELAFEVSHEHFSRLCKQKTLPQLSGGAPNHTRTPLLVREYGNGSLRFRVRCCRMRSERGPVPESVWVTQDMMWPDHIFVGVNEQKLTIRRGTHNGKDLPIELTDFIISGTNRIKVAVPRTGPTAGGKEANFSLAIEMIEISNHSALLNKIETNNRIHREETLGKIRIRVDAAPDEDDEIAVIDRNGSTTSELSISLTDPFSASIFRTPARGATCTHFECFDLETWLNTRPAKQQIKCGHRDVCTCTKRLEPTEPDKWKCPICFEDARPKSLRVDSFLVDVRKQLEERNQLDVKSILVAADGTWRPVVEPDDEDDEGSDGDGPVRSTRRSISALRRSAPVEKGRATVEVIELD